MPAPVGLIITVSVLVAAGIAVYKENPQVREWIDRTRHKIVVGFHSLGDDMNPGTRRQSKDDASMHEDRTEKAEERRRQAIAEIMERGRIMEERRKRRKLSNGGEARSPSFDTLVDENGILKSVESNEKPIPEANTTAIDTTDGNTMLRSRHANPQDNSLHQSVDATLPLRQLSQETPPTQVEDPFESRYEREMRTAWNMPMPTGRPDADFSSHASESLVDLTPTTDDIPDPEVSIPSADPLHRPMERSEYFSAANSTSSHTLSDEENYYYAHPSNPLQPVGQRTRAMRSDINVSVSSAPSIAGSTDHIHRSDIDDTEDGIISEVGDGIRTPGSAWTEVDSNVSGDA